MSEDNALLDTTTGTIHRTASRRGSATKCGMELVPPYARADLNGLLGAVMETGSSVNLCRACYPETAA